MFNYEGLPDDLKLEILESFFNDIDTTKSQTPVADSPREHSVTIPLTPFQKRSAPPSLPQNERSAFAVRLHFPATYPALFVPKSFLTERSAVHVRLLLHPSYQALFTSKSFLATALPIFIKATTPEIVALSFHPCQSPPNNPAHLSIPSQTLRTILAKTPQIRISTDQLIHITKQIPLLRDFLPSLRTVALHDPAILTWSRFVSPTSSPAPDASSSTPKPQIYKEVFQTLSISEICAPSTRRLLTEIEIRLLETEKLFPGDLSVLCRYNTVLSGNGPLPPIEVRRIVSVACHKEVSVGRFLDVTERREVLIDLVIDVGRERVLKAAVMAGELVED